ncbi:SulP family inorganic anion transporter [Candidatus Amarolinea aalborgensis]|uniref:SulP family inorganic anion transporter n=1 Tax=Candidatus Amarolinea aalborgensis TaxID=2249329 RepID=UPI003BF95E6D
MRVLPFLFLRPVHLLRTYRLANLQPDMLAGLTIAVVLLPQAIVFSLLAGLPPQMGIYTAVAAGIVGALWGSSSHLNTGPTNSASVLVLSILAPLAAPGTPPFMAAAGMLAVMAGILRIAMGLARLGILVNFVSDSVIVGFTAGAGVLVAVGEVRHLLRLDFSASGLLDNLVKLAQTVSQAHPASMALGLGAAGLILGLKRLDRRLPGPLIALLMAGAAVALFNLAANGVKIIGQMPGGFPPLARLPLLDLDLIGHLSTGALAIAAIGLVEATSIARSIASQSGERLNSNQEFVGQGMANIAAGLFSGYPASGSFNRSALNLEAKARSPMSNVFGSLFVLIATLALGPLVAFVPRAALAGVLIVGAYGMIDRKEMQRIWRGARGDTLIMIVTLSATLLLPLQFAVLSGILMSLAYYLLKTSMPQVRSVVPDEHFRHWIFQPDKPVCPQLGVVDILGDLYFGAASHIEESVRALQAQHPTQRYLMLRMQSVDHCDISGIHALESILRLYRERGGDVYFTRVRESVLKLMKSTAFFRDVGADHFLGEDNAVEHLFYHVLDPAICIYESDVRVFRECQNLPRPEYGVPIVLHTDMPAGLLTEIEPRALWDRLRGQAPPVVVDVRQPREFKRGHIAQAQNIPLVDLLTQPLTLPHDRLIVLACRAGRRSARATYALHNQGYNNCAVLQGGMQAWEDAGLLEAVD